MLGNILFAIIAPIYGWSVDVYGHSKTMLLIAIIISIISSFLGFAIKHTLETVSNN